MREKQNQIVTDNSQSNNQTKDEQTPSPEETKRLDVNFLAKNRERIRLASLRNKYELKRESYLLFLLMKLFMAPV